MKKLEPFTAKQFYENDNYKLITETSILYFDNLDTTGQSWKQFFFAANGLKINFRNQNLPCLVWNKGFIKGAEFKDLKQLYLEKLVPFNA